MNKIISPCIGACSTVYGDDYCRGCKRHVDEVTDWVSYADKEKLEVINRLDQQLFNISRELFSIHDQTLLKEKIEKYKLNCDFSRQPVYWVFRLLHQGHSKIKDLSLYGISVTDKLSPSALFDKLDQAFYQLACMASE